MPRAEQWPPPTQLLYFWRSYETHIELAFHSRNWIKRAILPVPPLSGTCFSSSSLSTSSYNVSLSSSPKYLSLNPGISMKFGLDCYHFSRLLPSDPLIGQILPEHTIYHLYWRADLAPLGERQVLLIQSLLITQDPAHSSIILWTTDASLLDNSLLIPIVSVAGPERFTVQVVDPNALAKGTYMQDHPALHTSSRDKRGWVDGDLIRVLVLYAHGGVWIDMDSLVLRSFRPLLEQEWVTQWDCYEKPYAPLNGAVLHFQKHSPYLCEMLYAMATGPAPRSSSTDWGSVLYHQLDRRLLQAGERPFAVLPYCLADSRSCRLDNRLPDPFEKDDPWIKSDDRAKELAMKLDSIFSIHLHNQWEKDFPKGGWMERLVIQHIQAKWQMLALAVQENSQG